MSIISIRTLFRDLKMGYKSLVIYQAVLHIKTLDLADRRLDTEFRCQSYGISGGLGSNSVDISTTNLARKLGVPKNCL